MASSGTCHRRSGASWAGRSPTSSAGTRRTSPIPTTRRSWPPPLPQSMTTLSPSLAAYGGPLAYAWFESVSRVVVGVGGDREVLASARDVTDRVEAAAALASSEERYRRIVDLA